MHLCARAWLVLFVAFGPAHNFAETEYQQEARYLHNKYRTRHDATSLYSNSELHQKAIKCAQFYADLGTIDHSCPHADDSGENIYAHWGGNPSDNRIATRSINNWYEEELNYRYNGRQSGTGHFTQMVWKGSRDLGFGIARKGDMTVAVALYYPAGNLIGSFERNVKRSLSKW